MSKNNYISSHMVVGMCSYVLIKKKILNFFSFAVLKLAESKTKNIGK